MSEPLGPLGPISVGVLSAVGPTLKVVHRARSRCLRPKRVIDNIAQVRTYPLYFSVFYVVAQTHGFLPCMLQFFARPDGLLTPPSEQLWWWQPM